MLRIRNLCCLVITLYMTPVLAGSLYQEDTYDSLVSDHRSHTVGDILTVLIYEQATATTSTTTGTNKSVDVGASLQDGYTKFKGAAGISNDFDGGGTSNQVGKLAASVSVTIKNLLPNGDMVVAGEQIIAFNNDTQHIILSGTVRPQDISKNNTVISTRLANANIEFKGEGLLSRRAKPGLITRFFNWLF